MTESSNLKDNRIPVFQAIHAAASKDKMKQFNQVNHLLGHFCRATGYDPIRSITGHLSELFELLQSGTKALDVHQAIDTYADNLTGDPGDRFDDFMLQFTTDDVPLELPNNTARSMNG